MNLPNGTDRLWAVVHISRQIEEILPTQSNSWLAIWRNRGCAIGKMLWSWVGILICPETRRSTDAHVGNLGGAVITASTQSQPGLPATSSPDAELRGISRAAREAIFLKGLASDDFQLPVKVQLLWSDSSTGITAAKRIGPGSKLRHLEVCEFYVQGAVQTGRLQLPHETSQDRVRGAGGTALFGPRQCS